MKMNFEDTYVRWENIYKAIHALPVGELRKKSICVYARGKASGGYVAVVLIGAVKSPIWLAFTFARFKLMIARCRATGKAI